MFKKNIGILGGMGPVASADTYVELTRICQRKYRAVQDYDYPTVILYSLPLKQFSHTGFGKDAKEKKAIISQLVNALQTLEKAGSDFLLIDCNTVHYFFKELQASVTIPIINLVDVTIKVIVQEKIKSVGVLCSQTSKDVGLYAKPLKSKGINVIAVTTKEQDQINNAILAVMSGKLTDAHITQLDTIILRLTKRGAERIILGCTEISNVVKQLTHHAILLDSQAIAIEQILAMAK